MLFSLDDPWSFVIQLLAGANLTVVISAEMQLLN